MKITLSYHSSEQDHCAWEWDVPYLDVYAISRVIDERLELSRLRRELYELKKAMTPAPAVEAKEDK